MQTIPTRNHLDHGCVDVAKDYILSESYFLNGQVKLLLFF